MSYTISWYVAKRVLYVRWPEELTLEALAEANLQLIDYLNAGTPPVHTIQDTSRMKKFPKNLLTLKQTLTFLSHPSLGLFLAVSEDPAVVFIGTILPQMANLTRNRVFRSMDDLLTFLQEQDGTVDWSAANRDLLAP